MNAKTSGLFTSYSDVWVVDGIRTAFAEFNGVLGDVSPIDLGIKVVRSRQMLFGVGSASPFGTVKRPEHSRPATASTGAAGRPLRLR